MALHTRINLVVCQHSKIQDWIEHFKIHYPDVAVVDMTVKGAVKTVLEWGYGMPVIGVINYELTFRRKILKSLTNFTLMLDESSLIQNENAKRSKFILSLKPTNVILLSGTPTGGKYEKLWSQCRLLGWNISKDLFWKQYVETEWVESDGFWRQRITGYKNVDRLKKKLADYGAVFMTTDDAGITLPEKNMIQVKTAPSTLYRKFLKNGIVSLNTGNFQEFELDSDFWGSNEAFERELIGDTSLTRRLYARQLCGLYNPARYEAFREFREFRDLVNSTDDRLIVFYNFTEERERMQRIVQGMNRPVSVLSGDIKDLKRYLQERPDSLLARQTKLLESIPGAGFLTAVTIVCEIGDFSAFRRPKQLYSYFGLDPVVRQSGNSAGANLRISKRGSPYARRCFYILALQSVSLRKNGEPKNSVLRNYYQEKCKCKAKMTALGAVMHKLCNIVFAVLRDERPFVLISSQEHRQNYLSMRKVA